MSTLFSPASRASFYLFSALLAITAPIVNCGIAKAQATITGEQESGLGVTSASNLEMATTAIAEPAPAPIFTSKVENLENSATPELSSADMAAFLAAVENLTVTESLHSNSVNLVEVAVDPDAVLEQADSLLEFGDTTASIRPVQGPIADSAPEVYTSEQLENLHSGFFIAPGGGVSRERGIFADVALKLRGENGNTAAIGITGGTQVAGLDVSYTQAAITGAERRLGYRARVGFLSSTESVFLSGEDAPYSQSFLPRGEDHQPWVNRMGGSLELFIPVSEQNTILTPSVRYQHVRITDSAFGDNEFGRDGCYRYRPIAPACDVLNGNQLSLDNDGSDDLLYLSLFLNHDGVEIDEKGLSISGTRYQIGTEQSIPIGDTSASFNRLSGGIVHYLPLNLFGFAEGPRTLALNLQAGTIIGEDFPPYEAFNLGGYHSVRGFSTGDAGTAKSFAQLLAEYRFPILNLENSFLDSVRGSIYLGYATDFGSSDDVPGEPGPVRTKQGGGVAAGAGLSFNGLPIVDALRVDFGVNGLGDFRLYFGLSQQF